MSERIILNSKKIDKVKTFVIPKRFSIIQLTDISPKNLLS